MVKLDTVQQWHCDDMLDNVLRCDGGVRFCVISHSNGNEECIKVLRSNG